MKKDVLASVTDGKSRDGSVVAYESIGIGVDERMEILPAEKIGRAVEVFGKHAFARRDRESE